MPSQTLDTPSLSARTDRRRNLISLTPLIDIVFILLVFFMLASSFLNWRAIELDPPARSGGGAALEGALLIDIRPDGLRLGGEAMGLDALVRRVAMLTQRNPDRPVILRPAPDVSLQTTVTVLDRLSAENISGLSFMRTGRRQ